MLEFGLGLGLEPGLGREGSKGRKKETKKLIVHVEKTDERKWV